MDSHGFLANPGYTDEFMCQTWGKEPGHGWNEIMGEMLCSKLTGGNVPLHSGKLT